MLNYNSRPLLLCASVDEDGVDSSTSAMILRASARRWLACWYVMIVCGGDGCGGMVMEAGRTNGDIALDVDGDM